MKAVYFENGILKSFETGILKNVANSILNKELWGQSFQKLLKLSNYNKNHSKNTPKRRVNFSKCSKQDHNKTNKKKLRNENTLQLLICLCKVRYLLLFRK